MGLYLCVFDEDEEELEAVEVGSYADYGRFIAVVIAEIEGGSAGSVCPALTLHHDSDGVWTPEDCKKLLEELKIIATEFQSRPPVPFSERWMQEVAQERGLVPKNLYGSFIDIEGDPLIERLGDLCSMAIRTGRDVVFQ